jgi:hypothetical protein
VQKVPWKWNIVHTGNEEHAFTPDQPTPEALMQFRVTNSTENGDTGADLLMKGLTNNVEALNTARQ